MAHPIWKDYYVNLGADNCTQFRIIADGNLVYSGKSYKRPGQESNLIRINDICADYLENVFPSLIHDYTPNQHVEFDIEKWSGSFWEAVDNVSFNNDWSYDYDFDPETMGVSFPVNGKIDGRQWLVFTVYNVSVIEATIKLVNGESFDVQIPIGISGDFNQDFNNDFTISVGSTQMATAVFNLSEWGDVSSITIEGKEFNVVSRCNKYALYYLNAHGGWDSLLIDGNHSEVDNLTRHFRKTEYDNRSVQNRSTNNYVNEIEKSLTLHTSWMSDAESKRMHHLLNSTDVYLGDIDKGVMIPVVLTDSQTEYKTYKGNGGNLVNYSINVKIAQDRVRR